MCTLLGCDGLVRPNIDENRLHTTPLAAPAAAPIPGEPPMGASDGADARALRRLSRLACVRRSPGAIG
jgi:hypothetical protein